MGFFEDVLPFYALLALVVFTLRGYFKPFCAWLMRLMDTPKFDEGEVRDDG